MKAAELRIGNKVNRHFENGEPEEIDCSVRDIFDCQRAENEKEFKFSFSPIPLTEEWLLKFGFTKKGSHYFEFPATSHLLEIQEMKSNLGITFHLITKRRVEPRSAIGNALKFVHQLQNLYFALTGEELNY